MPYQSSPARSCGWSWSSSDRVRYRKLRLEFRPAAIAHRRVWSEERGEGFVFAIIAAEEQMVVVANDWTGREQQQQQQRQPFGHRERAEPSRTGWRGGRQQKRTEYQVKAKTAKQKHARNVKSWFP